MPQNQAFHHSRLFGGIVSLNFADLALFALILFNLMNLMYQEIYRQFELFM